jgi:membrane-bound lytic murein transglycosylase A
VLRDLGLEIAWIDDPIGLFFLHIQGSGQLVLPDGRRVQVNYAGSNGRPYRSVGQLLATRGVLPPQGASMQTVRDYLADHPLERDAILQENQRYTFFRIAETGPVGSTDVEVTGGRTIATDPTVFPPGSLAYIRTRRPAVDDDDISPWVPLRRLVLNQDAGAAIKGPTRVDIYFGTGDAAEAVAGRMAAEGDLYFLVPPD